jgi:hypothetical protein
MTPPQVHINVDESFKAGIFPIKTVGAPTIHGAVVTGMQGIGVIAPAAAAVAAATMGFDVELHWPKGRILTKGLLSMMLASGVVPVTRLAGNTDNALGAVPKLHCSMAPMQT